MPSPFPGMDPYLEDPRGWGNIHTWLLMGIAEVLAPPLDPDYFVSVEERVYVTVPEEPRAAPSRRVLIPDVSVTRMGGSVVSSLEKHSSVLTLSCPLEVRLPLPETVRIPYLAIRDLRMDREVVTVLEVLSPTNKQPGKGRKKYLRKREALLDSSVNLVEIDLLRSGPRMPVLLAPESYHYSILVSRDSTRPAADFYPFTVRDPFPVFVVPLRPGEPELALNLGQSLADAYDRGRFHLVANYKESPNPPLSPEDMAWTRGLLKEKGL